MDTPFGLAMSNEGPRPGEIVEVLEVFGRGRTWDRTAMVVDSAGCFSARVRLGSLDREPTTAGYNIKPGFGWSLRGEAFQMMKDALATACEKYGVTAPAVEPFS